MTDDTSYYIFEREQQLKIHVFSKKTQKILKTKKKDFRLCPDSKDSGLDGIDVYVAGVSDH